MSVFPPPCREGVANPTGAGDLAREAIVIRDSRVDSSNPELSNLGLTNQRISSLTVAGQRRTCTGFA